MFHGIVGVVLRPATTCLPGGGHLEMLSNYNLSATQSFMVILVVLFGLDLVHHLVNSASMFSPGWQIVEQTAASVSCRMTAPFSQGKYLLSQLYRFIQESLFLIRLRCAFIVVLVLLFAPALLSELVSAIMIIRSATVMQRSACLWSPLLFWTWR